MLLRDWPRTILSAAATFGAVMALTGMSVVAPVRPTSALDPVDEPPVRLFGPAIAEPGVLGPRQPWQSHRRLVTVRWQALRPMCERAGHVRPRSLALDLVAGGMVVADPLAVTRLVYRPDTFQWRGIIRDVHGGRVVLTAVGLCDPRRVTSAALTGTVTVGDMRYRIESRPGGRAVISEIDVAAGMMPLLPDRPGPAVGKKP